MQNMIEGHLEAGQSVVVIEDLVSTGKSSLQAVDALRKANANVKGMAAIFTYGFEHAREAFEEADVQLVTLTDYSHLIKQAFKADYIDQKEVESLEKWRVSPETWGQ